jgi:hypothetical protein
VIDSNHPAGEAEKQSNKKEIEATKSARASHASKRVVEADDHQAVMHKTAVTERQKQVEAGGLQIELTRLQLQVKSIEKKLQGRRGVACVPGQHAGQSKRGMGRKQGQSAAPRFTNSSSSNAKGSKRARAMAAGAGAHGR